MDWLHLFEMKELALGDLYYTWGQVEDLAQIGTGWNATVRGNQTYYLRTRLYENGGITMSCTCRIGVAGGRCAHMAAVVQAIADTPYGKTMRKSLRWLNGQESEQQAAASKKKESVSTKQLHPFHSNPEEYHYYDMEEITSNLIILADNWNQAKKLVKKQLAWVVSVKSGFHATGGGEQMRGQVASVNFTVQHNGRSYSNDLILTAEKVYRAECRVPGCGHTYGSYASGKKGREFCPHLLAGLILAETYIRENNPGDATDEDALLMMNGFLERQRRDRRTLLPAARMGETQEVVLAPKLEIPERGDLQLSFRVGAGKMYVLKNMTDFVTTVEEKGTWELGKNNALDFAQCSFAEKSLPYYRLIRRMVLEGQKQSSRLRDYYGTDKLLVRNSLPLYGERLDEFFNLVEGERISAVLRDEGRGEVVGLEFRTREPRVVLLVRPQVDQKNVFHGITVSGEVPTLWKGTDYQYYLEASEESYSLNRLNGEADEAVGLLSEYAKGGKLSLRIGRKNLPDFYYSLLPRLRSVAEVVEESPELIQKYLPPAGNFTFYLDAKNGDVTCYPAVTYGKVECSLMEHINSQEEATHGELRDLYRESEALDCVLRYFPVLTPELDRLSCNHEEERIYQLLQYGLQELMHLGEVQSTDRFRRMNLRRSPKIQVGVSVESGLMELSVTSEDLTPAELLEILFSYKTKKNYHRLKNGDFIRMEDSSLEELASLMETMHLTPKEFAKGKMHLPLYRSLYLDKMLEQIQDVTSDRDKTFKQLMKDFKTVGDSDFEVPQSLRSVLRGYQVYGHKWLRTLLHCNFGGILADDMGLGKTLQIISVLLALKEEGQEGTSLIVVPASLVYNWQEEFRRFAPELSICVLAGSREERRQNLCRYRDWDVLITSYDLLKRDIAEYEGKTFLCHILDEAQYIKTHTTAAAKSVKVIRSQHRLAMTGTPIENRLSELWSIFDFLMPGFLYGYETFRKEMERPIAQKHDEAQSRRLRQMVQPFILRRLKRDVLKDLPDKLEEVRYLRMEKKQQQLYDAQVVRLKKLVADKSEQAMATDKLEILAELTRIRQICCDPSLLFENYAGESAKREGCLELIQSAIAGEHRMLVFSQFTTMLGLLEADLKREGIPYYTITGATPKQERLRLVKAFNEGDIPVFLISLKAGGVGLNLTGADVVIHYDPWWNLAAQNQATDRAHRIGQTREVSVYKLIVKDTIEEKILNLQESKKELAEGILSGEGGSLMSMSREELLQLFE